MATTALKARRLALTVFAAACAGIVGLPAAHAQDYPVRPIRLVIPFATGGSTDAVGRLIATNLAMRLGQPVVVENRPGAGSQIGVASVAKAAPDGYTLLLGSADGLAVVPAMKRRTPYDPSRDFTPVSMIATAPLVFATNAKFAGNSLADLVAAAKAKPGGVSYGSAGIGSILHLGGELLQSSTGTQMLHAPYQGGGPMMLAVVSGEVDFVLSTADFVKRYVDSGQMKALAQADTARHPLLPNTPTTAEVGMKDLIAVSWFGVLGPAGMPQPIVDRLAKELSAIVEDPAFGNRLIQIGSRASYRGPAAFADHIALEYKRWGQIVQQAKVPLQEN